MSPPVYALTIAVYCRDGHIPVDIVRGRRDLPDGTANPIAPPRDFALKRKSATADTPETQFLTTRIDVDAVRAVLAALGIPLEAE